MPIIALTANAVVGMREMFISNGFNDFLSKPIDVSKFDEMLDRWIPKTLRVSYKEHKEIETGGGSDPQMPVIPGVDTEKGIAMTGGTIEAYRQVLSIFCKDAQNRLELFKNTPSQDTLSDFVINVHAIKSASASIGSAGISSIAAGLEEAGKAKDIAFIGKNLPGFVQQLSELVKNIGNAVNGAAKNAGTETKADISAHIPTLRELYDALKTKKISEIKNILNTLEQQARDPTLKENLELISDQVLMTEFDIAAKIVEELLAKEK